MGSYDSYSNSDNLKRNFSLGGYDVVSEKKAGFSFSKFHNKDKENIEKKEEE
jgi:hypothetical protein